MSTYGQNDPEKLEELCKRVQDALYEWYAVPKVLETRAAELPEIDTKSRAWFDYLENAICDLQDELQHNMEEQEQMIAPDKQTSLLSCPACGGEMVYDDAEGAVECSGCETAIYFPPAPGRTIPQQWNYYCLMIRQMAVAAATEGK